MLELCSAAAHSTAPPAAFIYPSISMANNPFFGQETPDNHHPKLIFGCFLLGRAAIQKPSSR